MSFSVAPEKASHEAMGSDETGEFGAAGEVTASEAFLGAGGKRSA